ncbi:MAG: aminoglycoside phosphotransferase family protein [Bacillota bacterium]
MKNLVKIADAFCLPSNAETVTPYGCGHINDTYLVQLKCGTKFIMQRVNHNVFPNVPALMANIVGVTNYIAEKTSALGKSLSDTLQVINTKSGDNYLVDCNNYYRMYNFIDKAISIETTPTQHQLELSGKGFGVFQKLLNGYPADSLSEPIANFHNTEDRLLKFKEAIANNTARRLSGVAEEVEFFLSRADYATIVTSLITAGSIPLRVTHNDTKLNNVLIDIERDEAVAVIDLDTVMPGSILYDFGDSIRSGANLGAEDERDLAKVQFSLDLFRGYTRGFVGEVAAALTSTEIENMAFGAILMTYECGMRFLTDYLNGDTYFKVHREGHNLDRARTQIKMVQDMEKVLPQMTQIVKDQVEIALK